MTSNGNFCCKDMQIHLSYQHHNLYYNEVIDEYGICVVESRSYIVINYCPWCGKKLPPSKKYAWFNELEEMGYENPIFRDDIPDEYKSAKWRMKK